MDGAFLPQPQKEEITTENGLSFPLRPLSISLFIA